MRSLNRILIASCFTLAASACDDMPPESTHEPNQGQEQEIEFRGCTPPYCSIGIGNTSLIGTHRLSNLSTDFGSAAMNASAYVAIDGGYYLDSLGNGHQIEAIDVEDDGELRLQISGVNGSQWVDGEAVRGAQLTLLILPTYFYPAFSSTLLISDVRCEPGLYDPSMEICAYQFLTPTVPGSPIDYPMHPDYPGYYRVCPDFDDGGTLDAWEKYAAVLSPHAGTNPHQWPPNIHSAEDRFIFGCLNGAISKTQYRLNAFYDPGAYRGLDPNQQTAALLMWLAWHDGQSQTIPGRLIQPHDPINGLFTWQPGGPWGVEAGYDANGAACAGDDLTNGIHRNVKDPETNLPGWSALPDCNPYNVGAYAPIAAKALLPSEW